MNWEQKLEALLSLTDTSLRMRAPGNWYVSASDRNIVEGGGAVLCGSYGNGTTPEEAVVDDFRQIAESRAPIKSSGSYWQWAGFMWRPITFELACTMSERKARAGGGS